MLIIRSCSRPSAAIRREVHNHDYTNKHTTTATTTATTATTATTTTTTATTSTSTR